MAAFKVLILLLSLSTLAGSLKAAGRYGLDASLGWPISGPFRPGLAPGFGASAHWPLTSRWQIGAAYSQHTFFGPDYYVSARSIDLRLRHLWPLSPELDAWAEAGAGINPMAWHFSNWPGWGRLSGEAGVTWQREKGPAWELGFGLAAYGPPEQGLLHALLRLGPRW